MLMRSASTSRRNVSGLAVLAILGSALWNGSASARAGALGRPRPSKALVSDLASRDRNVVLSSLHVLTARRDPAGREQANGLLKSQDDYVWFNAALYLGAIGDGRAVPYLIKGLEHPARRAHGEAAARLKAVTRQTLGQDQKRWIAWWRQQHPDSKFDFVYHNLIKRAKELQSDHYYLIRGVFDPTTIDYTGSKIALIGIRLKKGADPAKAVALLKQLVVCQMVQLEFDGGPVLAGGNARRAFVYWEQQGDPALSRMMRRGLPPVPFKARTLINGHLLKSQLYQLDSASVQNERMRRAIEEAAGESSRTPK